VIKKRGEGGNSFLQSNHPKQKLWRKRFEHGSSGGEKAKGGKRRKSGAARDGQIKKEKLWLYPFLGGDKTHNESPYVQCREKRMQKNQGLSKGQTARKRKEVAKKLRTEHSICWRKKNGRTGMEYRSEIRQARKPGTVQNRDKKRGFCRMVQTGFMGKRNGRGSIPSTWSLAETSRLKKNQGVWPLLPKTERHNPWDEEQVREEEMVPYSLADSDTGQVREGGSGWVLGLGRGEGSKKKREGERDRGERPPGNGQFGRRAPHKGRGCKKSRKRR